MNESLVSTEELKATLEPLVLLTARHDNIIYGPNGDDGFVTEIPVMRECIKDIKRVVTDLKDTMSKLFWALGVPFMLAVIGFVGALITHKISVTFGP